MARRWIWWTAAAALVTATAIVAAVTAAADPRPVHFWVRTGESELRPHDSPDGACIAGWTVDTNARIVTGQSFDINGVTHLIGIRGLGLVESGSTLRRWLRKLPLVPQPAPTLGRRVDAWSAKARWWLDPGDWVECVDDPAHIPDDAVPDAALEGAWEVIRRDGSSGPRWDLAPGGRLVYERIEHRPADWGQARWGRIGDILYLDTGPGSASGVRYDGGGDVLEVVVLSPDLRTWRAADGTRGRRCR